MGFLNSQGSSTQTSSRTDPDSLRPEISSSKNLVVDNTAITSERALIDTFVPQTAVNTDLFKNELSMLAGYPEGRVLEVTYFYQVHALTNIRSMNVERVTLDTDWTHYSFVQIRNFELRSQDQLEYEYNNDTNISSLKGTALTFAGFEPYINDMFIYKLRNEKIGLFVVNSVQRTAIGNDTYHKISFDLVDYLNDTIAKKLADCTKQIYYFDKTKFTVGNQALLTTEGYGQKNDLSALKKEVVNNFMSQYYTTELNSFVRPDGVYDPYVVEYWNKKVNFDECATRPTQLLVSQHAYSRSIWGILTGVPLRKIELLANRYAVFPKRYATWDTNVNALVDRRVLYLDCDLDFEISSNNLRRFMSSTTSAIPYFDYPNFSLTSHLQFLHKKYYHDNPHAPDDGQCIHHLGENPHHHHHQLPPDCQPDHGEPPLDPDYSYPGEDHDHCHHPHPDRPWPPMDPPHGYDYPPPPPPFDYRHPPFDHPCLPFEPPFPLAYPYRPFGPYDPPFGHYQYPDDHPWPPRPHPYPPLDVVCPPGHHPHHHCPPPARPQPAPVPDRTYALSYQFYTGDMSMCQLERLIYDHLMNKELDVNEIISCVEQYRDWDRFEGFYWQLLALHLIDYCQHWLVHHS